MFIKLGNSSEILTVNLNAFQTILVLQENNGYVLALQKDKTTQPLHLKSYPKREHAIDAYENMNKLEAGDRVCDIRAL